MKLDWMAWCTHDAICSTIFIYKKRIFVFGAFRNGQKGVCRVRDSATTSTKYAAWARYWSRQFATVIIPRTNTMPGNDATVTGQFEPHRTSEILHDSLPQPCHANCGHVRQEAHEWCLFFHFFVSFSSSSCTASLFFFYSKWKPAAENRFCAVRLLQHTLQPFRQLQMHRCQARLVFFCCSRLTQTDMANADRE